MHENMLLYTTVAMPHTLSARGHATENAFN